MPRGDRTGPAGEGPMTGRGQGYCSGSDAPGYDAPGPGLGRGVGWGARGGWGGRGYRNRFWAMGLPRWRRYAPGFGMPVPPAYGPDQEVADLKTQAGWLSEQLSAIQARLDALTGSSETKKD